MRSPIQRLAHEMAARENASDGAHGADFRVMRDFNRLLVLNCVRTHGPLARISIAKRTGLSRTTVGSIIDTLLTERLVREGRLLDSGPSGGRRAVLVHFNADAGRVIGIDVGRTHLTFLLTDLEPTIRARWSTAFAADRGALACLPGLLDHLRRFMAEQGITWESLLGVGLGIPGPLDVERRMLVSPPHMPGWDGINILDILRRELPVPIYIDNDANMGALGECRYGAGRGIANLAYVKIGTGIGAGLVLRGQIFRGSDGSAGELGHITIDEDGPPCVCGSRGCLETLAAAQAIVADARTGRSLAQDRKTGVAGHDAPRLACRDDVDIADVLRAAVEGDPASCAAIRSAGEQIGIALAGLVNLFNPSLILVDGSVARAGELLLAPVRAAIALRGLPAASARVRIVPGALGDSAIGLGAVATVLDAAFGPVDMRAAQAAHWGTQTTSEGDASAPSPTASDTFTYTA